MSEQYTILLEKLDKFIRKYYKNQLIKGSIYCLSLIIIFFLIVNLTEYFGRFSSDVRTFIFYIYLLLNVVIIFRYIVYPVVKILKIGNIISQEEAAVIIGKHFSNVSDKLLNTLQLKKSADSIKDNELIIASIDQKITELKPIPFQTAINFNLNRKYLKYLIIPAVVLALLFLTAPNIITEPSSRLVNYSENFDKIQPFKITVINEDFNVVQHEDYLLKVKVKGEEIPDNIYLEFKNNKVKLNKENIVDFNYVFINVRENFSFKIKADEYSSNNYEINVIPKPIILDFEARLEYPPYTQKKDEVLKNIGDFVIPEGTKITWNFLTQNTDRIQVHFDTLANLERDKISRFTYSKKFYKNYNYYITSSNQYLKNSDSLTYTINVIPDLFPMILAEEYRDSVFDNRLYFRGSIKDDYGFRLLTFNVKSEDNNLIVMDTLSLIANLNPQEYYHFFDLSSLKLSGGDNLEYYFEVWDNDRINGSKSARSQIMTYRSPTINEINEEKDKTNTEIKEELEETIDDVKKLQKDIEDVNKKLVEKKELSWDDREQIKQLIEKQSQLQEKIDEIKNKNEEKSLKEQQYKEINEEILNKLKQLEDLFNKLTENEELKKLFEELEKLIDEMDKEKIDEMLEEMKMSNEEMEKMLDRNLEIFKQLEFEQKMEETIDNLEKLAEKQNDLSQKTEDKKSDLTQITSEQEEINKEFEQIQKDIEDLDKLNKELETPNDFDKMEESQEEVSRELNQSQENLENSKRNKASESQKNAGQKMSEMAQDMLAMQQDMIQEGMSEDMDALRSILENLIQLSFDQEDLISKVNETNINDPRYTGLIQEQKDIKDDLKIVEDSLYALSKRQIMIEPFVTAEIISINKNIGKSIDYLNNRRTDQAAGQQQYVMTSINNLALMLSETLNQMMQSMSMPSNSACKNGSKPKPGSGKGSIKSMKQLQEQLNQQIQQMKSGKKDGGEEKNGKMSGNGQSMSEQLARSAAQQEYIRNQIRELSEQLEKQGEFGSSKELKKIMEEMEKTESDLVNKMITQETLMRQKEILTRLLRSEQAELEREKEEKRESTESKNKYTRNPEQLFKYKKVQNSEVELLKTIPPSLQPFYKQKVNQYFFNFDELLEQ